MNSKMGINLALAILGVVLFSIGGVGMKMEWFGNLVALPGILIGVGCGVFGHNLGAAIQNKAVVNNPVEARKIAIEQKDERNVSINNAAKGKAFDAMGYIYGTVMLICVLLNVDLLIILLLVGAYLLVYGNMFFHLSKLNREM